MLEDGGSKLKSSLEWIMVVGSRMREEEKDRDSDRDRRSLTIEV